MPDRVGQHLGNYRLIRLLGQGSSAEVYLGQHRYLHSAAALKVLRISLNDEEVRRFLEGAQTLVRLKHNHIVRVLDFAVEQSIPVLVMDYAPGGTLRQRHPQGARLSLTTVVSYVKQIAAALQYAHNQHVIHRDVKPENLLFGSDQRLLLSDFGLALFAPSLDLLSTQAMAGTIPYMAPEQLRGKPCFASDQYALGVITYEWLCGRRPFEGRAWEVANQHMSVAPPSLRKHCPELSPAVERIVLRALAKDPQQRYVSVQAFAQALDRVWMESIADEDATQITAPLQVTPRSSLSSQAPCVVFLAAAPTDEPFAIQLQADLKQRGILLSNERPGRTVEQEDAVRRAIRAAHLVVVVSTPQMRTSRLVREELRIAQMYQRRLVFLWAQGDDLASLLGNICGQVRPADVIDARGVRYMTALEELLVCLRQDLFTAPIGTVTCSTIPGEPRNPYKGLHAFTQKDAEDFFGRDGLVQTLVTSLRNVLIPDRSAPVRPRLLTVLGPSGSGKSSVLLAGLLPRLRSGALPASEQWVYLGPIVPGDHPLEALQLALSPRFPQRSAKALREDLEEDSARGLHLLARQLVKQPGERVLLVIDQFEEVFTQTSSEQERQRFIELLVTAATEPWGPVTIVLTLRTDFYERLLSYPDLFRLVEHQHEVVLPLQLHELREIIERPAALPDVQVTFEGNLVGDLLFEAQGQVGALPLLEFTLDQLFQWRTNHRLTLEAYQQLGGLKGALAKHAEAVYAALPSDEHRRLARDLFLRLIDPGMSEQDSTRRRASLSELFLPDPRQTNIIREVAEAFVAARLLTSNEVAGRTTIEVSHEALIREWTRLADWLREGREDMYLQRRISEDVSEWERREQPKDRLYRGSQLKEARAWARRNTPSSKEVAFLQASAASQVRTRISAMALILSLVLAIGVVVQLVQSWPHPNDPTVTNLHDAGPGSLRQAIDTAPPGSVITFDASLRGTILLTSGDLTFSKPLTLRGPGANTLAISSGSAGYGILITPNIAVSLSGLAFKNSTVMHKLSSSLASFVSNEGTLTLTNSIISGNTAAGASYNMARFPNARLPGQGGGLFNSGTLTLINCIISGNTADSGIVSGGMSIGGGGGRGGGIANSGTLVLQNSVVSGNMAYGGKKTTRSDSSFASGVGGGIWSISGKVTITESTISNNIASGGEGSNSGGYGGGIANFAELLITNSTVSDNAASGSGSDNGGHGGGIYNSGGILTITNSTIAKNMTSGGSVGDGRVDTFSFPGGVNSGVDSGGGGIVNSLRPSLGGSHSYSSGMLTLTNSTIWGNASASSGGAIIDWGSQADITFCTILANSAANGGGIAVLNGYLTDKNNQALPGHMQVRNSIVAGNHAPSGSDVEGAIVSDGYNLFQTMPGAPFTLNQIRSTDVLVAPGADLGIDPALSGESPQVLALLPKSPALERIPLEDCHPDGISTDERGIKRPQGSACDIGAYEYVPPK